MQLIVTLEGHPAQSIALSKDELDIGRDPRADIVLPDVNVSVRHARLFLRDGRIVIRDLGSTNGTTLNGRRLERPSLLGPVDVVRIGPYLLQIGE